MKPKFKMLLACVLACVAGVSVLTACAPVESPADLEAKARAATVQATGSGDAGEILISNLEKAPARADWNARTPGGQFACNSDERFALPECRKVGE